MRTLLSILFLAPSLFGAEVGLLWDPSLDGRVTGYKVYTAYASKAGPVRAQDAGCATNASVGELVVGERYAFWATAYDALGTESDPSNIVLYEVPVRFTVYRGTNVAGPWEFVGGWSETNGEVFYKMKVER